MRLINRHPERASRLLLVLLPFALLLFAYFVGSAERLADNPNDKLLPSAMQMGDAIKRLAFSADSRTGEYVLWQDTASSLQRLAIGLASVPSPACAWVLPPGPCRCLARRCRHC